MTDTEKMVEKQAKLFVNAVRVIAKALPENKHDPCYVLRMAIAGEVIKALATEGILLATEDELK